MPVKIRLQRKGRKKKPFYHIVVADSRSKRDGRYIERLGFYNPMTKPATIEINRESAYDWIMKGAQPTDTARAILRFKGVYYRKHLMRGVQKGAMSQEDADRLWQEWVDAKEAKVAARFEESAKEKSDWWAKISGVAPPPPAPPAPEPVEEAPAEEPAAEATPEPPAAEEPVAEAPAEEKPAEEPVVEAPAKEEAPAEPMAAAAPEAEVKPDDLKKIEGIGPKIAELLNNAGIMTFQNLADAEVEKLKGILTEAGSRYQMHDPTTWPEQSKMAAEGKWDELKKWQDELDGGKVADEKKED